MSLLGLAALLLSVYCNLVCTFESTGEGQECVADFSCFSVARCSE